MYKPCAALLYVYPSVFMGSDLDPDQDHGNLENLSSALTPPMNIHPESLPSTLPHLNSGITLLTPARLPLPSPPSTFIVMVIGHRKYSLKYSKRVRGEDKKKNSPFNGQGETQKPLNGSSTIIIAIISVSVR